MTKLQARLEINDASKMSPERRREVATWLMMHAADLLKDAKNYDDHFTGKFYNKR